MTVFQIIDGKKISAEIKEELRIKTVELKEKGIVPGLAVILDDVTDPSEPEQYAVLTVSFGEFIGMKNCAYIDTNNCDFADQLQSQGLASDTGFYKASGFCKYPLWQFEEGTLREIDNDVYQKYSDAYDGYMASMYGDEPDEDGIQEISL